MANPTCPKCKRKGTYSPKFEQCSACGLGYESKSQAKRVSAQRDKVTPVTNNETRHVTEGVTGGVSGVEAPVEVTPPVTEQSNETHSVTGKSKHCSTCTCGPPKTGAERQKKWRAKQ